MKKFNVFTASLFVASIVAGAVMSAGLWAQAQTTTTPASPVSCSVSPASVVVGAQVTLTASGGNGTYTWSSASLSIPNPTTTSRTLAVTFVVPGIYSVTVASNGTSAACILTVTATEVPGNVAPQIEDPAPASPGLPNTGELAV